MALVQILSDPDFSEISPISAHFGLVVECRNVWRGLTATRLWSFGEQCVVIRHARMECTGADSAGRYDAVALHVTVCKPLWTPHANGLALPSVAYLKGAKENSVASTS